MSLVQQPRHKSQWSPVGRTEKWQNYFTPRSASTDYSDYWALATDPDGNVRNRLAPEERERHLEHVAEEVAFITQLEPGRIVDFGCGPGWVLDGLGSQWDRLGVEISAAACKELHRQDIPYVNRTDNIPDTWADVVLCHHVIEHIQDPISIIGELRRILRAGGWLVLGTPDFGSPCARRFKLRYRMLHDKTHCSLFTLESMHRFLRDHGFTIRDVKFPFPARYATAENFLRWNDTSRVSPAWPGNWMTFYCQR